MELYNFNLLEYANGDVKQKTRMVSELREVLLSSGFFLVGHAVDPRVFTETLEVLKAFFGLPSEVKTEYSLPNIHYQRGYCGFGSHQAIRNEIPDPKEYWQVGREQLANSIYKNVYPPNVWPQEIRFFKYALTRLFEHMNEIANHLACALPGSQRLSYDWATEFPDLVLGDVQGIDHIIETEIEKTQHPTRITKLSKRDCEKVLDPHISTAIPRTRRGAELRRVLSKLKSLPMWRASWNHDVWSFPKKHLSFLNKALT